MRRSPGYLVLLCAWLEHFARRGRAWFGALGVGLAVSLALTWAAAGHAAVVSQRVLALPVDVVHLVAMGVWLGGLVTLVVILLVPFQRTAPGRYIARDVQIPASGTWQLAVTVRTSDIDQTTVTTPINIR